MGDFLPHLKRVRGVCSENNAHKCCGRRFQKERFWFFFPPAQSLLFCPKVTWKYLLLPSTADWRCRARTWSRRVFLTQQEEFRTSSFQIRKMVAQFLFCFASHLLLFREFPSCKNFSTYLSLPISSETAVAQKSCLFIGAGRHAQRLGGK